MAKKNRKQPTFNQKANILPLLEKNTMQVLQKNDKLIGNKTFGIVADVLNETTLIVEMEEAGSKPLEATCSPHVKYTLGDRVIVEYINNNPKDRFVVGVLNGGYDIDIIDYDSLPTEPVEIIYNSNNIAVEFIYGYDDPKTTWRQELERNEKGQLVNVYSYYPDGYVKVRTLFRNSIDKVYKYE